MLPGETGSKTNYYLPKLKAVGLDTDPYNPLKNQWSVGTDMWPGIRYLDIYKYLMLTTGEHTDQSLKVY